MKKNDGYLKLCNNRFEEEAEKLKKRAIVASIITTIVLAIFALIIAFA